MKGGIAEHDESERSQIDAGVFAFFYPVWLVNETIHMVDSASAMCRL